VKNMFFLVRLPWSFVLSELPKLSTGAQLLLFHLLSFSNTTKFKPCWPGQTVLMKRTNIKRPHTLRKYLAELTALRCLSMQAATATESTKYFFHFQEWIEKDIQEGYASAESYLTKNEKEDLAQSIGKKLEPKIKKTIAKAFQGKFFENPALPESLKIWKPFLEHSGRFQSTDYFTATDDISPAFVEEQFRKSGFAIKVLKQSA